MERQVADRTPARPGLMPVSSDSLLLVEFAEVFDGERILDLGCGSGIIALSLAARARVDAVGVDVSMEAVEEAGRRAEAEKSILLGTCRFIPGDLRNQAFMRELGPFDRVICNPPYYKPKEGRLPSDPGQVSARYETTCTLAEIVQASSWALGPGGAFYLCHIPARLTEMVVTLEAHNFSVCALRPVYTRRRAHAERILVRAVRGGNGPLRLLEPRHLRALTEMP